MDGVTANREPTAPARPYGFWGLCLSLAIVVGAAFLGLIAAERALRLAADLSPSISRVEGDVLAALDGRDDLLITAFAEGALILILLAAARWRGGANWQRLIGWSPWSPLSAGWRYWALLAGTIVYGLAASAAVSTFYPESRNWDRTPEHPLPTAVYIVLAVLMAPLAEELLFRGWIFTALRARRSAFAAIVLTAAVFAAAHNEASHLYALAVFPVGLALGRVRERAGSIAASTFMHASYNLVLTGIGLLGAT